jgi:hypothetical protein
MAEFDLEKLYCSIASYKGLPFPIGIDKLPGYKVKQFEDRVEFLKGKRGVNDIYGRPLIAPVVLNEIEMGGGKEGHIMTQPLVMIDSAKRIVKTPIAGGSYHGTIKEYINFDDYKIKMYGALINRNQKEYPIDQLEIFLKNLWKPNVALKFECEITNELFEYVVIHKMKLHELKKSPGIQMYEIEALSDGVQEVELLQGE